MKLVKNRFFVACLFVGLLVVLPTVARAQCADPVANEGQMLYNGDVNVYQICTPLGWVALGVLNPGAGGSGCTNPVGQEAEFIYNGDLHLPQYCDGDDWRTMIGVINGCQAPQDCQNIGDVCADGSLFAGFMADSDGSCRIIYAADVDQSTGSAYHSSGCNCSELAGMVSNGKEIQDYLAANGGFASFPAHQVCESLDRHGHQDWYLPARDEMVLVRSNLGPYTSFGSQEFWTASRHDAWNGTTTFSSLTSSKTMTDSYYVRCIRSVASGPSTSGGCTAPASCPNVGDVCSDGSLFAGFMLYGTSCEALYVTDRNQGASIGWKTSTGSNDIDPDDYVDGRANQNNRAGVISDFPAFELCESNTYHGKNDWYLPSRAELNLLWLNRVAINANAFSAFTTSYYWTSTEYNTTQGWGHRFSDNTQDLNLKTDLDEVRCVRRA